MNMNPVRNEMQSAQPSRIERNALILSVARGAGFIWSEQFGKAGSYLRTKSV